MMAQAHASCLGNIAHSEHVGNRANDVSLRIGQPIEDDGRLFDTGLQRVGGLVNRLLWDRDEADQVSEIVQAALKPAGLREANTLVVVVDLVVEDAVGELRVAERRIEVGDRLEFSGITERNGRFDGSGLADDRFAEAVDGFLLCRVGRYEFSFDRDWRASWRGDQVVDLGAGLVRD